MGSFEKNHSRRGVSQYDIQIYFHISLLGMHITNLSCLSVILLIYQCISNLTSMDAVIIVIFIYCLQITLNLFMSCKHSCSCMRKVWCLNIDCNKPWTAKTQNVISSATLSGGTVHLCGDIQRKERKMSTMHNRTWIKSTYQHYMIRTFIFKMFPGMPSVRVNWIHIIYLRNVVNNNCIYIFII